MTLGIELRGRTTLGSVGLIVTVFLAFLSCLDCSLLSILSAVELCTTLLAYEQLSFLLVSTEVLFFKLVFSTVLLLGEASLVATDELCCYFVDFYDLGDVRVLEAAYFVYWFQFSVSLLDSTAYLGLSLPPDRVGVCLPDLLLLVLLLSEFT